MTRTPSAKLALVLAWLVAVAGILTAHVAPAAAAAPQLTVALTSLRVTGSGDQQTAVLSGTLTNTGAQPAFGARVVLWRSRDPIREAADFRSVANGENTPIGERLNRSAEHSQWITQPSVAFDPGQSAAFTVRGTLADLGFTSAGTVYVFGVQVLGTADASTNFQILARARTFYVVPPAQRLPLTSLVLLSAAPTKLRPQVFANERLIGELTGRLDGLLSLADRPGLSWLVDPALIDEVTDLADGYAVVDGDGTRPGTGQQAAQAWLERFRALPDGSGARTLFGNPDVLGAEQHRATQVVPRAVEAMTGVAADVADLPLLVLPHQGVAGPDTPAFVRSADPDALLVSTATRGRTVSAGPAGSTLLRLAPGSTAAGPGTEDGPVQRLQRQAAEAVLGRGLVRLLTTAEEAAADFDTTPRWLQRTPIDDLLDADPDGDPVTLTLPAKTQSLPAARWRQLTTLAGDLQRYRDLVPESELVADASATLTRLVSTWWIGESGGTGGTGSAGWAAAISRTVARSSVDDNVTLSASARVLMSSRTNEFPLTIGNDLAEPVRVRIVFASDNPQRMKIPASGLITVGPGQNHTVNVRPEASANGLVNVTASLQTESGEPVGRSVRIAVEVTDLGMIGWIIVIVSGAVLVAATALRIRQVRRKQREDQG